MNQSYMKERPVMKLLLTMSLPMMISLDNISTCHQHFQFLCNGTACIVNKRADHCIITGISNAKFSECRYGRIRHRD